MISNPGMSEIDQKDVLKKCKINANAVKRLMKEYVFYKENNAKLQQVVEKMTVDKKDQHDIKKQQEVLLENEKMLPDTLVRFQNYVELLTSSMVIF
ncbi:TCP1-chaperonin cofactor A [Intoshia linei]|uniref:Tubulin-specific chaperone A n=1 Tax=Intoshia linei TaxID=1819745 RepID=A0A177BBL0_9BILA|nr:TCP1-chaperonin cofactor A [Intoshia linei]